MKDRKVEPYSIWKHFKGMKVIVITVAKHSETNEELVIYKCLSENGKGDIFARPLDMFLSKVDKIKYPNVLQEYRLEKIEK